MVNIDERIIDWLLEDNNPPVKRRALVNLLGYSEDSPEVRAVSGRVNEYFPIRKILENWEKFWTKEGEWRHSYKKYQGGYWQIIFLGDMGADGNDERIRQGCEFIIGRRNDRGMYFPNEDKRYTGTNILCLSANVLRGLYRLGFGKDERVLEGLETMSEAIVRDGGARCMAVEVSLLDDCYMTLPWVLSTLTAVREDDRSSVMKGAMEVCVQRILEREVFIYVPDKAGEWSKRTGQIYQETEKGQGAGVMREELPGWKAQVEGYVEKPGWKSFGFPLHYNPDILEALLGLKNAGVKNDPRLNKALEVVEANRLQDGRWKMGRSLNGKMIADVEEKGKPSKWVTVRALEALKWGKANSE